eukprot:6196777-Pleurochrysis_carterae.AAC.5
MHACSAGMRERMRAERDGREGAREHPFSMDLAAENFRVDFYSRVDYARHAKIDATDALKSFGVLDRAGFVYRFVSWPERSTRPTASEGSSGVAERGLGGDCGAAAHAGASSAHARKPAGARAQSEGVCDHSHVRRQAGSL